MPNDAFTTSWLAARLGADPARIEVRRRAGELFAVPIQGGRDHLYPAWQFDAEGDPLPAVQRVVTAARAAGMDETALNDFLQRRVGTGGPRMWELVRGGRGDFVVDSLRSAG